MSEGGEVLGLLSDLTPPREAQLLQGPEEGGLGQVSPWAISCGSGGFISWWGTVGLSPSWVSGPREGRQPGSPQGSPVWGCIWGVGCSLRSLP